MGSKCLMCFTRASPMNTSMSPNLPFPFLRLAFSQQSSNHFLGRSTLTVQSDAVQLMKSYFSTSAEVLSFCSQMQSQNMVPITPNKKTAMQPITLFMKSSSLVNKHEAQMYNLVLSFLHYSEAPSALQLRNDSSFILNVQFFFPTQTSLNFFVISSALKIMLQLSTGSRRAGSPQQLFPMDESEALPLSFMY